MESATVFISSLAPAGFARPIVIRRNSSLATRSLATSRQSAPREGVQVNATWPWTSRSSIRSSLSIIIDKIVYINQLFPCPADRLGEDLRHRHLRIGHHHFDDQRQIYSGDDMDPFRRVQSGRHAHY